MSIEINNSCNFNRIQASNKTVTNANNTKNDAISDEQYFKNVCDKYPYANLNMSDAYLFKKGKIAFNVSPKLINKAANDPKAAEKLTYLLDQIPSFTQFVNAHRHDFLTGRDVESVSMVIDENGNCSCMIKYKENKSKNTDDEEELIKKRKKAKALKQAREESAKLTAKEKAAYSSYNNVVPNLNISFLDKNV